ncbi:MAG: RNA pyrophosphohydrolase [Gammaproteobacteria bacterium]|nr:RNA pyrophosphohydrolase [Gammaproteobacteria bacterium]
MIDRDGYRPNVGIILSNAEGQVFWARRIGQNAWQFPQGGIQEQESPEQAMFRELQEETGLHPEHVQIMGVTSDWLKYKLPARYIRKNQRPLCIGQKQMWFLLRMMCNETAVNLQATDKPEFDNWRWVDYWLPSKQVIFFKRQVYREALQQLKQFVEPA